MASKKDATGKNHGLKFTDCSKAVSDKDNAIQCEVCESQFHDKCQDVQEDAYKLLGQNETIHWYCSSCNKGVAKIVHSLSKVHARQDVMEVDLAKMRADMDELKSTIQKIRDTTTATDAKLEKVIEAKLVEGLEKRIESSESRKVRNMKEDVAEQLEIEKRGNNLIFHGVKETELTNVTMQCRF